MKAGGKAFRPDHKLDILTGNDDLHPSCKPWIPDQIRDDKTIRI